MAMELNLESLDNIEAPMSDLQAGVIIGAVGTIAFGIGLAIVLT